MGSTLDGIIAIKVIFNSTMVLLAGLLTYVGLDIFAFTALGYLLLIDYVTGVMKARSLGRRITSNKMKYGIASKFSLVFLPFVLALAAKAMGAEAGTFLYVGMNILILSEVYSIIGNIYAIRTHEELPEWDAVAALGKWVLKMLLRMSGDKDTVNDLNFKTRKEDKDNGTTNK